MNIDYLVYSKYLETIPILYNSDCKKEKHLQILEALILKSRVPKLNKICLGTGI